MAFSHKCLFHEKVFNDLATANSPKLAFCNVLLSSKPVVFNLEHDPVWGLKPFLEGPH